MGTTAGRRAGGGSGCSVQWFWEVRVRGTEACEGGLPRAGMERKCLHVLPTIDALNLLWAPSPLLRDPCACPLLPVLVPHPQQVRSHPVKIAAK